MIAETVFHRLFSVRR